MNTNANPSCKKPPKGRWSPSVIRTVFAVALILSMPAWGMKLERDQAMWLQEMRERGFFVSVHSPPDMTVVSVSAVLALTGALINRRSKSRKPVLLFLLAVPVPIVLGLLGARYEFQEYARFNEGGRLNSPEFILTQAAARERVICGLVASLPVLLIGIGGLIWRKGPSVVEGGPCARTAQPFQFSLASLLIVVTVFAVLMSMATFTARTAWTASMLTVIGVSLLIAATAREGGCGLGVILLCLWFGSIVVMYRTAEPWSAGLSVSLLLFSIVRGIASWRRRPPSAPPNWGRVPIVGKTAKQEVRDWLDGLSTNQAEDADPSGASTADELR